MTRKPAGERAGGAKRREEARSVWQVTKTASRRVAGEGPAARSWVDDNVVSRFDPIAVGMARDHDAADDVVCPLEKPWPRIFPGL
jgi:hypothetical protein